jgi:hypothetical protein
MFSYGRRRPPFKPYNLYIDVVATGSSDYWAFHAALSGMVLLGTRT